MTTPNMPPDGLPGQARALLAAYIAEREVARAQYNERRRQADEDGVEFVEAWEFDEDHNDCGGTWSGEDQDVNWRRDEEPWSH